MNSLPPETLMIIVSFLDDKNKRILRLVSSQWFNFIKYNNFTLYLTREADLPQIADRFSKYPWPIELDFRKPHKLQYDHLKNYLTRITTLTGLKLRSFNGTLSKEDSVSLTALTSLNSLDGQLRMDLLGNFTNLTSIKLFENTFYAKLMEKFQIYTKLESVSLFFNVYKRDDIFQYFSNPTRLTALELRNYGLQNTENTSRFVNLKVLGHQTSEKLSLKFPVLEELYSNRPELLDGLETCSKLTRLDLEQESSGDMADLATYSTCIKALNKLKKLRIYHKYISNIDQTMKVLTVLPDLEDFCFYPSYGEHFFDYVFSYIISKKLTRLECLLNDDKRSSGKSTASCIQQIGKISTLKELSMRIEYQPGVFTKAFDYDPLMNLTNLTKFKIIMREEDKVHNLQKISKLTKLRKLELSAPKYLEANLVTLTNLEKLVISSINQKTFDTIHTLTLLTHLHVTANSEKINFSTLDKLLLLRSLNISPITGMADWKNLTLLTDLRELWISKFDTNDSIRRLTSLQNLTYLHCVRSKCSASSFTALTSLQKLFLVSESYSKTAENQILQALTNLRDWRLQPEGGFDLYLGPEDTYY